MKMIIIRLDLSFDGCFRLTCPTYSVTLLVVAAWLVVYINVNTNFHQDEVNMGVTHSSRFR